MFEDGAQELRDQVAGEPGSSYPGPAWTPELAKVVSEAPSGSGCLQRDDRRLKAEAEIMALASQRAAIDGRIVEILAQEGEALSGPDDLARWLSWAAGMKPSVAKSFIRLANKSAEVPKIAEALSSGDISFDKAAAIARVATPGTQDTLLEWAKNGTVGQLSSITSGYLKVKATDDKDGAHLRRHLSYFFTEDGSFRLRAQMGAEQGAVVARAIDAAADQLYEEQKSFQDQDVSETEDRNRDHTLANHLGPRQADALVSMAEAFLEHGAADADPSDRYRVLVHVDEPTLAGGPGGTAELEDGVGISQEAALRLACDCKIQALLEGKDIELKLGRDKRVVSPALKRALKARDRHCCFPGCTSKRRLAAHHFKHWIRDQGETEPANLTLLCPRHHRLVHEGHYTMRFDGTSAPRFFRPDGSEVQRVPKWPELTEVERYEWCARQDLDYETWAHWIEDFDLNEAVAYLLREDPERHPPERHPPPESPAPDEKTLENRPAEPEPSARSAGTWR